MRLIDLVMTKIFLAPLFLAIALTAASGQTNEQRFGFTGPEIFPIDPLVSLLHAADIDGDGKMDLVVVNNARSKINILYNQTGQTNAARKLVVSPRRELNELPPDARFRIDSIASEKRIAALVVADLNGDGRPDLAYYGEPKELVVQYNLGTNGWSAPKRWAIDDGQLGPNALTTGDLNGDKRTDLILLGESQIYLLAQQPDGSLGEPEKIPFSGSVKSTQVLDIDGDGRDDLLLVNWDNASPIRFRLQDTTGRLRPEVQFTLPAIRSYIAGDLDGDHKTEVVTIALNSGRAQISGFVQKPGEALSGAFAVGQFEVLPLSRTGKSRRAITSGDVNGDGLADLLVAEPDSGQLTVCLQQSDGSLGSPKLFPTLTGVSELAVADWDGDGVAEIFLLSADERQIGVSSFDKNGRVAFPTILSLDGKPLAMAVGPLESGAKPSLAVILDQDGKRVLVTMTADGKTKTQKLADSFKSNPSSLTIHDLNQDGQPDLVVMIPYEKIKVLIKSGDKYEEQDIAPPGGNAEQPWLSVADVDGDGKKELLLAQKNFLRAVVVKADTRETGGTNKANWSFLVKEQINGASSNSRIVGAAPVANGDNAVPSLFLLDAERKALTLCERDKAGVWQVVRNLPLTYTEFNELQPIGLGSKKPNSVAFLGLNAVGFLRLSGSAWEIQELDGYETPIKDGRLNDVVPGDLNNDGRKDLVFLETARNYVDIVTFEKPHQLVPANRWQVFEERTFRSRRNDSMEPREAVIADVTGDGKNDLILLVHDRILVYPQD